DQFVEGLQVAADGAVGSGPVFSCFLHQRARLSTPVRVRSLSTFIHLLRRTPPRAGVVSMTRLLARLLPCVFVSLLPALLQGAAPPRVEFPGFRTVETALTTRVVRAAAVVSPVQPGYLGIQVAVTKGKATV